MTQSVCSPLLSNANTSPLSHHYLTPITPGVNTMSLAVSGQVMRCNISSYDCKT